MGQASLFIPDREEVRMWIRDAMTEMMSDFRTFIIEESHKESEKLITRDEAARMLKMSLPTLNEKTKSELRSIKLGRKRMYRKSDIDSFIESKIISRK